MKRLLILLATLFALPALAGTATLNWTAPTQNTDGSAVSGALTYRVYGALQGQTKVLLQTTTALTWTHTAVPPGTYCYDATATYTVDLATASAESAHTTAICQVVPKPVPNPPSNFTVAVVAGINMAPVFKILSDGTRSTVLAGFIPVQTVCSGAVLFSYRGKSYRKVNQADVKWWATAATDQIAAPCA